MSDTIPDVKVGTDAYADINTLTGIPVGTALVITNKSPSTIHLQVSASQPTDSSKEGEILYPGPAPTSIKLVTSGENTVWGKSVGHGEARISVQETT